MEREAIDSLHEQASEAYLEGDYAAAMACWRRLLEVEPSDERAIEGLRLCRHMTAGEQVRLDEADVDVAAARIASVAASGVVGLASPSSFEEDVDAVLGRLDGSSVQMRTTAAGAPVRVKPKDGPSTQPGLRADARPVSQETEGVIEENGEDPAAAVELDPGLLESMDDAPAVTDVDPTDPERVETMLLDVEDETPTEPDSAALPDPARQGDGIELGSDAESVIPLAAAVPRDEPRRGFFEDPGAEPEEDLLGDVSETGETPGAALDDELRQRVASLLGEARAAAEAGERDEALALLARLFILDDNNAEARALEESVRDAAAQAAYALEDRIAEGVQWLEQGRVAEAAERFREVLAEAPGHAEAQHYLEEAERRLEADPAASDGDAPHDDALDGVRDPGAVRLPEGGEDLALARPVRGPKPLPAHAADPPAAETFAPVAAAPVARRGSRRGVLAVAAVVLLTAGGAGVYLGTDLLDGFLPGGAEPEAPAPVPRGVRGAKPGKPAEPSTEELMKKADALSAAASPAAAPTREVAERIRDRMAAGHAAMERKDYAAAVLAFNDAVELAPNDADAASALLEAGKLYREEQSRREELMTAERAFRDGDYTNALRILYRLPKDMQGAEVRGYVRNAWYNLGLVELRAGDLKKAMDSFDEALGVDAADLGTQNARALAARWVDREKGRRYYDEVESLPFRDLNGGSAVAP